MAITLSGIKFDGRTRAGPGAVTDPFFANVSLLLHGEGTNGSTTITDSSLNNFTMAGTPNSIATVSTSQFKYGTASVSFNGTNQTLVTPTNAAFGFGTGDFTWEFWFRTTNITKAQSLMDTRPSGSPNANMPWLGIKGGTSRIVYQTANVERMVSPTLSNNTWYFIALSRNSGSVRLFIDGVQAGSTFSDGSANFGASTNVFMGNVGDSRSNAAWWLPGFLDEVRITKGVGRYTGNFTPPTAAFPNS